MAEITPNVKLIPLTYISALKKKKKFDLLFYRVGSVAGELSLGLGLRGPEVDRQHHKMNKQNF